MCVFSGCDVNLQNYNNFDTALHLAAYRGHLDICKLLVSHRAHTTVKNTHGKSAYDEAVAQKHHKTAQFLYGRCAPPPCTPARAPPARARLSAIPACPSV